MDRTLQQIMKRFGVKKGPEDDFVPHIEVSGFTHPKIPVILQSNPDEIVLAEWGLLPSWAKDKSGQNNTLNAQFETLKEKPSFKDYLRQRCLVPAHGFYEWQWLDSAGKRKQKYLITSQEDDLLAFAGIYNSWRNPQTGENSLTFTIITTKANELMAQIHNTKQRMPVVLARENENKWLSFEKMAENPYLLQAEKIGGDGQGDLFG